MKTKKKIVGAALISVALIAPLNAYAWSDAAWLIPTQVSNFLLWAESQAEKMAALAQKKLEEMAQLAQLELSTLWSLEGMASTVSGTVEKQTAAEHELTQAEMNYKASQITAEAVADSSEKFSSNLGVASMCSVTSTTSQIGKATQSARVLGKSMTAALLNRDLAVADPSVRKNEVLENHTAKYCSKGDVQQGRCTTEVPLTQQNADIQISSLMLPANGTTYTDKESKMASDFVRLVAPMPTEPQLPPAMEKTEKGMAHLLTARAGAARMSVVYNSFAEIWAMRVPAPLNDADEGEGSGALSLLGLMKKLVDDTFINPAWKTNLVAMTPNETLREMAVVMAGKNYTAYQAYQQRLRMEALFATKLSIDSARDTEQRLYALKSKVN